MTRIALTGGAYQSRSVIAAAQRCLNVYPEEIPQQQGEPVQFVHLQTPGMVEFASDGTQNPVRGAYLASDGTVFMVIGPALYILTQSGTLVRQGTIAAGTKPVRMQDNGLVLVIVDGSAAGWYLTLGQTGVTAISDAAFYGSATIAILDTRLAFIQPNTGQFYLSPSEYAGNSTAFDSLYIASKITYPDKLVTVAAVGQNLWLIGLQTTELWFDGGGSDFPDERVAGVLISHGCAAAYSVATADSGVFWLANDQQGRGIVMHGQGYQAQRISTHAIEAAIGGYPLVSDAIGHTYQQGGHLFYVLSFPSADATWVYDGASQQWHERAWTDAAGVDHRIRANCFVSAWGMVLVGDWQSGTIYLLTPDAFDDAGAPIRRVRSFPHVVQDFRRVRYDRFVADMQTGAAANPDAQSIALRWSDDRGATWGNSVALALGSPGSGRTVAQLRRLGLARDRVFELSWTAAVDTSLIGAWIETEVRAS